MANVFIMDYKKKINVLNISKEDSTNLRKKLFSRNFIIGPWCKNNIKLLNEDFSDTLNLYKRNNLDKYEKDILFLKKNYEFILNLITK